MLMLFTPHALTSAKYVLYNVNCSFQRKQVENVLNITRTKELLLYMYIDHTVVLEHPFVSLCKSCT